MRAARRLEKLTAKLPPPAVTRLAIAVIDRLATGDIGDERALSDLKNRLAELATPELEAHRDTCFLARYLSEHTAEAAARVAAWTSRGAGLTRELFALDDARRFLSVVALDTAERMEEAREEGDAERLAFVGSLAAQLHRDAERLEARWKAALADLRSLGADEPIGRHRALLAELEKKVGADAVPARIRKPIELEDGARGMLPETIALFEECGARSELFARGIGA